MMIKQVIVMRTDLNMRKGKMIAQGAHASMKFLADRLTNKSTDGQFELELTQEEEDWLAGKFTKICVRAKSEKELIAIMMHAKLCGLTVAEIVDSGLTEFGGIQTLTCAAIGPHEAKKVDPITGHLELL